jgi:PBP1b-binding outer membrane lipoprotein LpoB
MIKIITILSSVFIMGCCSEASAVESVSANKKSCIVQMGKTVVNLKEVAVLTLSKETVTDCANINIRLRHNDSIVYLYPATESWFTYLKKEMERCDSN